MQHRRVLERLSRSVAEPLQVVRLTAGRVCLGEMAGAFIVWWIREGQIVGAQVVPCVTGGETFDVCCADR